MMLAVGNKWHLQEAVNIIHQMVHRADVSATAGGQWL